MTEPLNWAITAFIDGSQHWQRVWQAVQCHASQMPGFGDVSRITPDMHLNLWGKRTYYRAYSMVNGGRKSETDLFEGLR